MLKNLSAATVSATGKQRLGPAAKGGVALLAFVLSLSLVSFRGDRGATLPEGSIAAQMRTVSLAGTATAGIPPAALNASLVGDIRGSLHGIDLKPTGSISASPMAAPKAAAQAAKRHHRAARHASKARRVVASPNKRARVRQLPVR